MAKKQVAETKEVAETPKHSLPAVNLSEWGVPTGLTARDVVIPKILVMQALSKLATEGKAKFGDMVESLSHKKLGDEKNPLEFIPIYMEKVWVVFEEKNGAMKFTKVVPIDASNEDWKYEEVLNGVKMRRDRTQNFYVLLPSEVANGSAMPYVLSFRRTSAKAGQKIATTMYMKNINANKTPASMVLELSAAKTQNDKGTFMVLDATEKRASSEQEVAEAFRWLKTIRAGQTKVDTSDLEQEAEQSHGAATSTDF